MKRVLKICSVVLLIVIFTAAQFLCCCLLNPAHANEDVRTASSPAADSAGPEADPLACHKPGHSKKQDNNSSPETAPCPCSPKTSFDSPKKIDDAQKKSSFQSRGDDFIWQYVQNVYSFDPSLLVLLSSTPAAQDGAEAVPLYLQLRNIRL